VDQANVTACYVAERLGLPTPYSYETAVKIADKGKMKELLMRSGIPTSKYVYVDYLTQVDYSYINLPVVVKPADSNSSKGVKLANNMIEVSEFLKDALKISRSNKAIVEEFNEGTEVQFDFFVHKKNAHLIMTSEKLRITDNGRLIMQSYGSLIPAELSREVEKKILIAANKIAKVFNLDSTSLFIQAVVSGVDFSIIEFAPRVGGGLSFRLIELITGFNTLNETVNSYLGIDNEVWHEVPDGIYSNINIYTIPGVFGTITGFEELVNEEVIEEYFFYKTKGMVIGPDMTSSDRIGSFIVKAKTRQELFCKIKTAINRLHAYDIRGRRLMKKELYRSI
jgi:biotin carboxylase